MKNINVYFLVFIFLIIGCKSIEIKEQDIILKNEILSNEIIKEKEQIKKLETIYFDFDSYKIKETERDKLQKNIDLIKINNFNIALEGHCDERGTIAYNFILSNQRAAEVFYYLIKNGIEKDNLFCATFGKSKLISKDHSKNRRVEFKVMKR